MASAAHEPGMPYDCGEVPVEGQTRDASHFIWEASTPGAECFTLVGADGIASVHQGRHVTIDRVLGFERVGPEGRVGMAPDDGYDQAIFDRHRRIVAILRRHHDRDDDVIRIEPAG